MTEIVWKPPAPETRTFSRAIFGAGSRLPVLAGIARLIAEGTAVFTYEDVMWASGIQYGEVTHQLQRLGRFGLAELVDDEWRHYWRAVDSPLWDAALALLCELEPTEATP